MNRFIPYHVYYVPRGVTPVDDVDAIPEAHKTFREPAPPRLSFIASTPRRNLDDSLAVNVSNPRRPSSCTSPLNRTRPSPERLEAQIRNLSYNQDTVVKTLIEELKEQRKSIQQLQEKLESERQRWEEEKTKLTQSIYEAERMRDDERRRVDFDLQRVEEDKRRLEEDRRRLEEEQRRRDVEASQRLEQERQRMEQRYAEDRERIEELKRDFEQRRQTSQQEMAQWTQERNAWLEEKAQWAREKQAWQEEKAVWARERLEQEERLKRLQAAGASLSQGLPHGVATTPRPPMPHAAAADIYGSPFRGYPQTSFDVMQGYAGYGFPQYGAMAGGLQGYTYQDFPTQQQDTTGAQRLRGHRGMGQTNNAYTEDDEYYESEEDNIVTAPVEHPAAPGGGAALYLSPQQQGIASVVSQIPAPGFFSAKVSTGQTAPQMQSPSTQVAGKPMTLGSMVSGGDASGSTLAGLLATSSIASQAQGVALYQGSLQQTVPTSVVVPQLSDATSPINTRYPISMPQSQSSNITSTAVLSTNTQTTASSATSMTPAKTSVTSPVKPNVASPTRQPSQDGDHDDAEHHESFTEPHFEPLVTLPEVEVKTGEEEETVMFESRAKLYRFIEGQWKERGLGQIKILQNPNTSAVRVLMRREKIHKVCANHFIKPNMTIDFRSDDKEKKFLTWRATDYTDEPRVEQFCCKFKTSEIAEEFKAKFQEGVEISQSQKTPSQQDGQDTEVTSSTDQAAASTLQPAASAASSAGTSQPSSVQTTAGTLSQSASTSSLSSIQSTGFTFGVDSQGQIAHSTTSTSGGLFGMSDPTKASPGSVFGFPSTQNKQSSSIFGNVSSTSNDSAKAQTSVFGGFTFSQKPEVKKADDTDNEAKAKEGEKKENKEEKKANPFANFSFSATATDSGTSSNQPVFGSSDSAVGFGDIAKAGEQSGFVKSSDFKGFEGKGAPVFGSKATTATKSGLTLPDDGEVSEPHKGEAETEYEPDVEFKPIVTLPEVEVKTGEEEEEKLFCQRAKLYRLDLESKQWKERGVGELKILQHRTTGKCRILMRRDQVLKICANHRISAEMTITPLQTSEKTYRWAANDFTEQEIKHEMFAAKFKTQELADTFKDMFESCVEKAKVATTAEDKAEDEKKTNQSSTENEQAATEQQAQEPATEQASEKPATDTSKPLSEMFKAKEGEWECGACYVRNKKDTIQCVACESAKPGHEQEVEEQKKASVNKAAAKFSFGIPSQGSTPSAESFTFGFSKTATPTFGNQTTNAPTFGNQTTNAPFGNQTTNAPTFGTGAIQFGAGNATFGGMPSFGSGPAQGTATAVTFGANSSSLSFTNVGSKAADSTTAPSGEKTESTPSKGFSFNTQPDATGERKLSPEKPTFSFAAASSESTKESGGAVFGTSKFTFAGISPQKSEKPPKSPLKSPGDDGYYQEDDGEHIHFEPIVEMPKDYQHKTGEEDEKVLYSHRAKLFRFTEEQWKERGLGDVKLLLHPVSKKVRMVMRREQVLRICLNHYVLPEMELKPMAGAKDKAYTWHADDFSEGEVVHENFAIRFKTAEIAGHFKDVFDLVKMGKDIPEAMNKCPDAVPTSPVLAQKSPVKLSIEPEITVTSSTTPATFTFKSPTVTSSATPSFSGFKFSAPTFGSGVFGVGSSPVVFGSATQTTTSTTSTFTFGQTTFASATTSQGQSTETPKSGTSLFSVATNLFASGTPVPSEPARELQSISNSSESALNKNSSLLRSLLTEDSETGGYSALRSALDVTEMDDDVIFVSERTPSAEQERRAQQYMLPKWFFMYEDSDAPTCKGCIGCEPDSFDFNLIGQTTSGTTQEVENIIVPQQSTETGDRGNVHYAAQLDANVKEEVVQVSVTSTTGDKGNVHYSKELNQSKPEEFVESSTATVTGDRGNVYYAKELQVKQEELIQAAVTSTTGDKGNVHYSKELSQTQPDSTTSEGTPVFGRISKMSDTPTFGSLSQMNEGGMLFGSVASSAAGLGFADLAKQSPESNNGFAFGKKSNSAPFQWQGAGSSVFRASPTKGGGGEDGHEDVEQAPDVHFEPIVSLPEVQVVTGEEEETVLFCERAKLYRFISNEKEQAWKERGVGEVKILKHKQTEKFRVLMRREKILKIACNHAITTDMKLKPMQSSETAWCWNALDFAENEPKNEQFALKFKKKELASEFRDVFQACQEELKNQPTPVVQGQSSSSVVQPITEPDTTTSESRGDHGYAHGEGAAAYQGDEENEEEEDEQVEFSKRVTMHYVSDGGTPEQSCTGELRVLYDDDVIGYRIVMTSDQGDDFCNHIICRKYTLQKSSKKRFAEWTAKDFVTDEPLRRTFRVNFSSVPALDEFVKAFRQGIELAKESELDEVPDSVSVTGEILVPEVASSPKDEEE